MKEEKEKKEVGKERKGYKENKGSDGRAMEKGKEGNKYGRKKRDVNNKRKRW